MEMFWNLLFVSICVTAINTAIVLNFANKNCDQENTIKQTFGGTLHDCIEECERRSLCEAIIFQRVLRHCNLQQSIDTLPVNYSKPICMFLKSTDWIPSDLGPCNNHTCGDTEKCTTSGIYPDTLSCLKSECLRPPSIENATVLSSMRDIGSANGYTCYPGYSAIGVSSVVCGNDSTWSTNNLRCQKSCETPRATYNGKPTKDTVFRPYDGANVHFTCGKNYQGNGPSFSSTCQDGKWYPNILQCCENGTELWPWKYQCTFYTGPVSNKAEASAACQSKNYSLADFSSSDAQILVERFGVDSAVLLVNQEKPALEKSLNFAKCLESYNITITNQHETFTYDEKVEFIRNQTLTENECQKINVWAHGEPNGSDSENCILRSDMGDFLYSDINCDYFQNLIVGAVCSKTLPDFY